MRLLAKEGRKERGEGNPLPFNATVHWSFQVEKLLDVQREGTDADGTEMRFNTGLLTLHPGGVAEHNLQREGVIGGHLRRRLASYAPAYFNTHMLCSVTRLHQYRVI